LGKYCGWSWVGSDYLFVVLIYMNIEIIISEEDNELLRGEYLTWESAQEGLAKLQREFEKEQAMAEQMAEEGMCPECGDPLDEKEELCPECTAIKVESHKE
jgi:hypothetical protein